MTISDKKLIAKAKAKDKELLVVVVGPQGSGKSSVQRYLLSLPALRGLGVKKILTSNKADVESTLFTEQDEGGEV